MRRVPRQLVRFATTLLGITFVAFAIVRAAPGTPVALFGDGALQAGGATIARMREYRRLAGLDDPLVAGYLHWLSHLLRGDLGHSFRDGRPVLTLLAEAVPVTLLLSLPSLLLGYLVAVPVGVACALRPGGALDRALGWITFALCSLPLQGVALGLMLWAAYEGWPIQGLHSEGTCSLRDLGAHVALPLAALSYGSIAVISRYLRSSMLEEMGRDYVRTARAKGLSDGAVVLRHVLPNSLLSLITLFGLTLPALVSGAVIVERIFGLPGMGQLTFDAVLGRDLPVLMAVITLSGALTLAGVLAADLLYVAADPRISLRAEQA